MKFYHGILILFTILNLPGDLCSKEAELYRSNGSKNDKNQSLRTDNKYYGLEKIRLFDGSELSGHMIKLDKNQNLHWENESASAPINFNFKSVSNILFNRTNIKNNQINRSLKSMRLLLRNGDKFLGKFKEINEDHLFVETGFSAPIKIPVQAIDHVEFLPSSYLALYDSSFGLDNWKKSNSKSWDMEESDLVSVFSGSTGTSLPKKEAIEIQFQAEWERSFYLAIRIFSDSDGSSYGNVGYHLSFSNNRMNLQVNKRIKGRIIRETLGSLMLDDIMADKKGSFRILAHRKKKEFIISVNGQMIANWKDSSQDFSPNGNGILFINQGGNSFIRLKEVHLAGWDGLYFPSEETLKKTARDSNFLILNNGDSTNISSIKGNEQSISISTKRGFFNFPVNRLKSIFFKDPKFEKISNPQTTEFLSLIQSLGHLSCKLHHIENNKIHADHPLFGKFHIPLNFIKNIKCNLNILKIRKYLDAINQTAEALKNQQPLIALAILEKQDPSLRSWYWNRLLFLAQNMNAEEQLSFTPHPDNGLASASFAGDEKTILTTSKKGGYALWSGYAKLANGSFSSPERFPFELGRFYNEAQYGVSITYSFWLSETEVTQGQYEKLTKTNPNSQKNSFLPIVCSWYEAQKFCKLLNEKITTPKGFIWRLPTEAEWEKACRAKSSGPFSGSEKKAFLPPQIDDYRKHLNKFGWFAHNSSGQIQQVKQKLPNSLGFYDMHGNVWEWCLDATMTEKSSLLSKRIPGQINPVSRSGEWRILKGGCFNVEFSRCRTSYRGANAPSTVEGDRGFRVALAPDLTNSDLNKTANKKSIQALDFPNFGLKLLPVPKGDFLKGSPNSLTIPRAITRSFGDELITGSTEGILGITNFSGEPIKEIAEFNSSITSLTTSSDDQLIIVGCKNGEIHLVDGKTLTLKKSINKHTFAVTSIDISPKNINFCSSSLDGQVICHSIQNNEQNWKILARDNNVSLDYLEYNKMGDLILTSGIGSSPKLFDSKSGNKIKLKSFPYQYLVRSRFLPGENSFASITQNGTIIFTESVHGLVYKIIKTGINDVTDFSFSPHGKRILIQNKNGLCSIRRAPNNNAVSIKSNNKSITHSPDYFFSLAQKSEPSSKNLKDFLKNNGIKDVRKINQTGYRTSPDNKIVVTSLDGALRLWSKETGLWITTLGDKLVSPFIDCTFSPNGSTIVARLKTNEYLIYSSDNRLFIDISGQEKFKDIESWF